MEAVFRWQDEAALVEALRQGDPEAYEQLIEQYADGVYRVAFRLLQNQHDAEDAMQEAFLSVYLNIGSFQGQARLSSWLYRIATNKAMDLLRKRSRKTEAATDAWEDLGENAEEWLPDAQAVLPEDWAERQEVQALIQEGLATLSPGLRAAFVLFEMEGLRMDEVAETLEISPSAAKVRVHRARQALRGFLAARLREPEGEE